MKIGDLNWESCDTCAHHPEEGGCSVGEVEFLSNLTVDGDWILCGCYLSEDDI